MEVVVKSNGKITTLEVGGKEIKNLTMINFIGAANSGVQCVYERIITDEWGHPLLENGGLKREIVRVEF